MATIEDIKNAQAQEKADLASLAALVPQILAAVANGALAPADAQAILDEMNSQDSTIKSTTAAISAAIPPAKP